jgi:hypothetical protein
MKLNLIVFSLIIFSSSINLCNAEINNLAKVDISRVSICLKSNKIYCTQKDDEIGFEVSINNVNVLPKIIRFLCFSLYNWDQHNVVLNIVHDEEKYMLNYCAEKCASLKTKILIKGFPFLISNVVRFNSLVRQNDTDFLVRKKNTSYGTYSIQAAYICRKDTLFSNKIFVEFKKE